MEYEFKYFVPGKSGQFSMRVSEKMLGDAMKFHLTHKHVFKCNEVNEK